MSFNKKRIFFDKPYINDISQYTFLQNLGAASNYEDSSGLPPRHNKFSIQDLYSTVKTNEINEAIIQSNIDYITTGVNSPLRFNSTSNISINSISINHLDSAKSTQYCKMQTWIFDRNTYDVNGKTASEIMTKLNADITPFHIWDDMPNIPAGLYDIEPDYPSGLNETVLFSPLLGDVKLRDFANSNPDFNLDTCFAGGGTISSLFQENLAPEDLSKGDVFIVFYLEGDRSKGPGDADYRLNRVQVFTIPYEEIYPAGVAHIYNQQFTSDLGENLTHAVHTGDGGVSSPAFIVDSFEITISTIGNMEAELEVSPEYDMFLSLIKPIKYVNIGSFNKDILDIHPNRELDTQNLPPYDESVDDSYVNEYSDFLPVPTTTIKDSSQDLQAYYKNKNDRTYTSAPTTIEFGYYISDSKKLGIGDEEDREYASGDELIDRASLGSSIATSKYMFLVIDWDDKDDKYETWEDVLEDWPTDENSLLNRQRNNLYKFADLSEKLYHNYTTPGIKKIKSIMFDYQLQQLEIYNRIEPIRWKLITSKVYLDIPISQFPDFGQVGGAEYTTIPWPYTTPVIGGVSENSNYLSSIESTLAGGKIGDTDIIDETFLRDAQENDELGKNIEQMDLEQVRYFNSSYDMSRLLLIDDVPPETKFRNCKHIEIMLKSKSIITSEAQTQGFDVNQYQDVNQDGEYDLVIDGEPYVTGDDRWYRYNYYPYWVDNTIPFNQILHCDSTISEYENLSNLGPLSKIKAVCGDGSEVILCDASFSQDATSNQFCSPNDFINPKTNEVDVYMGMGTYACTQIYPDTDGQMWSNKYSNYDYWDGGSTSSSFSEETSVGQIFIDENIETTIFENCEIELNTGNLTDESIDDSSGNSNKGLLIGDYKIYKSDRGIPMERDTFIKMPKKTDNKNGAL